MGFLDGTTNNVLLDATLTDIGRQLLARNDGSFSIHKFALVDDEVDYGIIKKYGRTVGKERIEKCTPVFESSTNQLYGNKYKLISVSNPFLIRLPKLSLSGDANVNSLTSTITIGRTTQKTASIYIEQTIVNETQIDVELRDQTFKVEVPNLFVEVLRDTPEFIDGQQRASYIMTRSPTENSYGGSILQFTLSAKAITDATFTVYGTTANKNRINTTMRISGMQSGASLDVSLVIDKTL